MAQVEVILPKMGESVAEATITNWLKQEGDKIEAEESIVEIATDKVDSEVPSPSDGIIVKLLFAEGDTVKVGEPIAIISSEGEVVVDPPSSKSNTEEVVMPAAASNGSPKPTTIETELEETEIAKTSTSGRFYSPLVRNIAKTEGITMLELDAISGTGKGGRVTKNDMMAYIPTRVKGSMATTPIPTPIPTPVETTTRPPVPTPAPAPQTISTDGNVEIIEMDRMRKLIADHMVMSKHTSPHVTSFVEADVTNMVNWRNNIKGAFEKREGEKITFTPLFVEAVVKALKDFPMVNVSIDGNSIIRKKDLNIGIATALPSGNLIVPVVRYADRLNLTGLAKTVNDLVGRARINKLQPDEIQGGTFTLTNVGTFGNLMGTPIINQPQVAILATGAIKKKPVVIETPTGDTIGIRQMMYLSLSYDHRVVDGALGGSFLRKVADYLEQFEPNRDF